MQITSLKEEKKKWESEMQQSKEIQPSAVKMITPTRVNLVSLTSLNSRTRSPTPEPQQLIKNTRDAEVMCSVITRNVGIATQSTRCRTLGVGSDSIEVPPQPIRYSSSMQTELSMHDVLSRLEAELQIQNIRQKLIKEKPVMKNIGSQNDVSTKNNFCQVNPSTKSVGVEISIKPTTAEVAVEAKTEYKNSSCTANIVQKCAKCEEQKKIDESSMNGYTNSSSLSLLNIIKDKPVESKLNLKDKVTKHIGTQVTPFTESKQTQSSPRCDTKSTQQSTTTYSKSQQYDLVGVAKYTDTANLIDIKDQQSNTTHPQLVDASCGENIKPHVMISCADNYCDTCKEHIRSLAKAFSAASDISRIPRPTTLLTASKPR